MTGDEQDGSAGGGVPFDDRVNASAERALLAVLQSRRDELKTRLEESSTEWGLEDPIYRFYHQSFKVCGYAAFLYLYGLR